MASLCECAAPGRWSAYRCWVWSVSSPTGTNTCSLWSCAAGSRLRRGKAASTISWRVACELRCSPLSTGTPDCAAPSARRGHAPLYNVAASTSLAISRARLPAERRRRAHPALQPCGERPDQVAQDRRLAENRGGAEPAHVGSGLTRLNEYSVHGWRSCDEADAGNGSDEGLSSMTRRKRHAIPAMHFPCAVRTQRPPVADRLRRFGRAEGGRCRCDNEMGSDLRTKRP